MCRDHEQSDLWSPKHTAESNRSDYSLICRCIIRTFRTWRPKTWHVPLRSLGGKAVVVNVSVTEAWRPHPGLLPPDSDSLSHFTASQGPHYSHKLLQLSQHPCYLRDLMKSASEGIWGLGLLQSVQVVLIRFVWSGCNVCPLWQTNWSSSSIV